MIHRNFQFLIAATLAAGCGKADSTPEAAPATPATTSNATASNATASNATNATASNATANAPAGAPTAAAPSKPAAPPAKAASRGAERKVYSLVDNRLSAHLTRGGGLLLPGGSAGFAKYVRFSNQIKEGTRKSWDLRQTDGGIKVARMTGKMASVFAPLTKEQAKQGSVRIRINAKAEGALSLRINENEKKEINGKVTKGWQTVTFEAGGQLVEGENALQLFTKASDATVAWIQIGGKTAVGDDGATGFYDAGGKALAIPQDASMSWYVHVPEKGRISGDLSDGNCTVNVSALADDGASITGKLNGTGSAVDLAALGGKAVRLDLDATGCERALLSNAALVVPGDVPTAKRGDAPKHVLFIIMDSLRADRVKPFNPKARPDVPVWDKLAESSAVFLHHYVQGTESQVSHASMWTSLYLAKHKASQMADKLPDKWMTIDEVAKKAGKFVAGVSANGYIRPARGYGNSWDKYINHIEKGGGLKASDIIKRGMEYITPNKDKPWFLYMGFIDTHVTWRAKSPWIEKYDGGYKGRFEKEFGDEPNGFPKDTTDKEKDHVRAIYDSNVSYQDDQLGKLIETLKGWGIWDQTMLIITADHGDELWEDGKTIGHARSPRQTVVHVPMLIHYPPMFPAGKHASGTEGIDIVPTIADALGVAVDPEWQGASLISLATAGSAYPQLAMASQYENFHAGRIGNWKLRLAGTGAPALFNLKKDPHEKNDLWGEKGTSAIGARLLLDPMWILRQWNGEWKKAQWGNAASVSSRFAADLGE